MPQSRSQADNCSLLLAYTILPSPTQACAAAHIRPCSPEVYTVASARSSTVRFAAAHRAIANSGWRVASPPATRLRSAKRSVPCSSTSTEPKGSSPATRAAWASSTQRRRCPRSESVSIEGSVMGTLNHAGPVPPRSSPVSVQAELFSVQAELVALGIGHHDEADAGGGLGLVAGEPGGGEGQQPSAFGFRGIHALRAAQLGGGAHIEVDTVRGGLVLGDLLEEDPRAVAIGILEGGGAVAPLLGDAAGLEEVIPGRQGISARLEPHAGRAGGGRSPARPARTVTGRAGHGDRKSTR